MRGYEKLYHEMDVEELVRAYVQMDKDWLDDRVPAHRVKRHREKMRKAEVALRARGVDEKRWRLPEEPDIEF